MPKRLESQQSNAMKIMARVLLCSALGLVGGSGCLFPQSDQVLPTLPPVKNQPLQIVLSDPAAQPYDFTSGTKPNTSATPCDDTTFFINVDDPDLGDTIRSLWFIDKTDVSLPFRPNPVTPGAQVTRKVTQPNSTAFKTAMSSLTTGTHLLTVFVVVQFVLSQEVTGKDTALSRLNAQIAQLTELLSGQQMPGTAAQTRVRAALGGIRDALFYAAPTDDPAVVRAATLAAACGALGIPAPRQA